MVLKGKITIDLEKGEQYELVLTELENNTTNDEMVQNTDIN